MRLIVLWVLAAGIVPAGAVAAAPPLTGFPFADEAMSFKISGPGGVVLGQTNLSARRGASGWAFELKADLGIPGFPVKDVYSSHTNSDFCSTEFIRETQHGSRKGREEETVDRSQETVTRATISGGIGRGGKSDFAAPDCVKDALTMFYFARQELGQGRVPSAQPILFGGLYDFSLTWAGAQTIQVGEKLVVTDRVNGLVNGPASRVEFEMYFARDPARTPLLVKIPLAVGSFSLELIDPESSR